MPGGIPACGLLHPLPGLALTDKSESAALQVQGVRSLQGHHTRIGLAVLRIEHVAAPLVVACPGGAVHDQRSDLTFSALILHRDDLAAQLAAAIVEIDLRAGRGPHPRSERVVGSRASNT